MDKSIALWGVTEGLDMSITQTQCKTEIPTQHFKVPPVCYVSTQRSLGSCEMHMANT